MRLWHPMLVVQVRLSHNRKVAPNGFAINLQVAPVAMLIKFIVPVAQFAGKYKYIVQCRLNVFVFQY
jgi:hypothetical protein|tara:strand:- start:466 stop:666 length:201 start_codon:yes stop_codon:yes gene_type:complete